MVSTSTTAYPFNSGLREPISRTTIVASVTYLSERAFGVKRSPARGKSELRAAAPGPDLAARGNLIDADTVQEIGPPVSCSHWGASGETAETVLGDDWHQIA